MQKQKKISDRKIPTMLCSSWDGSLWQMRILHEHIERACQVFGICIVSNILNLAMQWPIMKIYIKVIVNDDFHKKELICKSHVANETSKTFN
mgnify:CR=1 FL=1